MHVVPVPVEPPPGPFLTRSELNLPDRFTFLFVFDFWSGERKNPGAVVEAFTRAFGPDEGPILVLKSIHGRDWKPRQFARVEAVAEGRDDIVIRDGYVSANERDSYVAACDCYVSLHRSEGLGLTMAEAMALGKPVIASGYSGNLEFMSDANSYLVPYDLVEVPSSWWAHAPGATWAEPDVDAAAALMTRAWEQADEARALGDRARVGLLGRFSPLRTAEFMRRSPRRSPNKRRDQCARVEARRAAEHPGGIACTGQGLGGGPRRGPRRAADLAPASVPPSSALALLRRPAACRYGRPRCGHLVASLDPGPGTARAPARGLGQARRERAMTEAAQAVNERQSAPP